MYVFEMKKGISDFLEYFSFPQEMKNVEKPETLPLILLLLRTFKKLLDPY